MTHCIFVGGTDTNVGKTVVSGLICRVLALRGLSVGYFKPVQSGALPDPCPSSNCSQWLAPDCQLVEHFAPQTLTLCSYALELPAAPQLAAELSKPPVHIDVCKLDRDFHALQQQCNAVVVEGAGGLAVPLTQHLTVSDLAIRWKLPLVLVTRPNLGTINHTTLSLNYAHHIGLEVLAMVVAYGREGLDSSDPILATAPRFIQQLSGVVSSYSLPYMHQFFPTNMDEAKRHIDPLIDQIVRSHEGIGNP